MDAIVRELEVEFGTQIATAAEAIGRAGEAKKIPAAEIYTIVTHAVLLFAATLSVNHMSRAAFLEACGLVFDGAEDRQSSKN